MPGRGSAPKDPARRARVNKDPIPSTVLRQEIADAPDLPDDLAESPHVVRWWNTWVNSPQADFFSSTDWDFLLETAFIAHSFYHGDRMKAAPELRLRVAKFGATPEDRARLRMQFAAADDADAKRAPGVSASRANLASVRNMPARRAVE